MKFYAIFYKDGTTTFFTKEETYKVLKLNN